MEVHLFMECRIVKNQLEGYLNKSIDNTQYQSINKHLLHCKGCQEEEKMLRHINSLIIDNPISAPVGFTEDVMNIIMSKPKKQQSDFYLYRWGATLAAAGVLIFMINISGIKLDTNIISKIDKSIVAITNNIGDITEDSISYSKNINSYFKDSIKSVYESIFKEDFNNGQ